MTPEPHVKVTLAADCPATAIPSGTHITLEAGDTVEIVQTVGGAVTVRAIGGLARVEGAVAAGLGLVDLNEVDRGQNVLLKRSTFSMDQVTEALRTVYDPEIPIDVVELGLIYRCDEVTEPDGSRTISIDMSMTSPGCGMGDVLLDDVQRVVAEVPGVDNVTAELVWEPAWDFGRLSDAARLQLGLL